MVFVTTADTAVSGGNSGLPGLTDTGVNFAYIDRSVRNLFQYFYSVTAFDVNSVTSGPTSLESARATKIVTPRALAGNVSTTVTVQGVYGSDGVQLNTATGYPSINSATGTFAANVPPANDGNFVLSGALEALTPGTISLTIDSVTTGFVNGIGPPPPNLYFTLKSGSTTLHQVVSSANSGVQRPVSGPRATRLRPRWSRMTPVRPGGSACTSRRTPACRWHFRAASSRRRRPRRGTSSWRGM